MHLSRLQVKGDGRTACHHTRGKEYDTALVQFGEVYLFRNRDAKDAKLKFRWTKGVFVGKNEKTDEFLLLTPKGARTRRVLKELLGTESWDKEFMIICVGDGTPTTPILAPREEP